MTREVTSKLTRLGVPCLGSRTDIGRSTLGKGAEVHRSTAVEDSILCGVVGSVSDGGGGGVHVGIVSDIVVTAGREHEII